MIILFAVALLLLLMSTTSKNKPDVDVAKYVKGEFAKYASVYGTYWNIPAMRLLAHIAVESNGRRKVRGLAGEIGITQIMPSTLEFINKLGGFDYTIEELENNDWVAIECTACYLSYLRNKYGSLDIASQAYNGNLKNPATAKYLELVKAYQTTIENV